MGLFMNCYVSPGSSWLRLPSGPFGYLEINQDQPNENKRRLFIRSLPSPRREGGLPCVLAEARRRAGKERCGRRQGRVGCALVAGGWLGEAGWRPAGRRDALWDWLGVCVWLSLVGPRLAEGVKLGGPAVINQVLLIRNHLLTKAGLSGLVAGDSSFASYSLTYRWQPGLLGCLV